MTREKRLYEAVKNIRAGTRSERLWDALNKLLRPNPRFGRTRADIDAALGDGISDEPELTLGEMMIRLPLQHRARRECAELRKDSYHLELLLENGVCSQDDIRAATTVEEAAILARDVFADFDWDFPAEPEEEAPA